MLRARLERGATRDEGTIGALTIPARAIQLVDLELPWRQNSPRKSCIPAGLYVCSLRLSSKWSPRADGRLFEVLNVPGRDEIKIHAATWAGDVDLGWHSDLRGCIAPGRRVGILKPPEVDASQLCVLQSRDALTEFMKAVGDEDFELDVTWADGASP